MKRIVSALFIASFCLCAYGMNEDKKIVYDEKQFKEFKQTSSYGTLKLNFEYIFPKEIVDHIKRPVAEIIAR